MKLLNLLALMSFLFLSVVNFCFGQKINVPVGTNTSVSTYKGEQYIYKINLYKISNASYRGSRIKLKLMQNAAVLDENKMLYPKIMADYGSLSKVCPNFLFGYKNSLFTTNSSCRTQEKASLDFTDEVVIGSLFYVNIPVDQLTKETKLVLGIYGAEIMLSNGTSKKLKKANVRSFRLMDMDFSVRNYIKYEVDIDGARITLEYVIERTTKK